MKRALYLVIALALVAIAASFVMAGSIRSQGIPHLLACMDNGPVPVRWACEHSFFGSSLSDDERVALNRQAGAQWASIMSDAGEAEAVLNALLAQRVDIDARDLQVSGMTAVHIAAVSPDADQLSRLLRHGANPILRDLTGRLPIDYARQAMEVHPDDATRLRVVKLLERRR